MNLLKNDMRLWQVIWMVGIVIGGCGSKDSSMSNASDTVVTERIRTIKAENRVFKIKSRYVGIVHPMKATTISASIAGQVISIRVSEGTSVKEGDIIAIIDTSVLVSQKRVLEEQLAFAEDIMRRREKLKEVNAISEVEYLSAANQVEVLKRQLNTISAQIKMAIIRAPYEGLIDEVMAKEGQWTGPGMPLARIISLNGWEVKLNLPERLASSIKKGDRVEIKTGDTILPGTIKYVSRWIEPSSRIFNVIISLPGGHSFWANQKVDVIISEKEVKGVLLPPEAIHVDKKHFVWIAEEGIVRRRDIKILWNEGDSMIVAGINSGEEVIVEGTVEEGKRIKTE